jgi:hypothetical protein
VGYPVLGAFAVEDIKPQPAIVDGIQGQVTILPYFSNALLCWGYSPTGKYSGMEEQIKFQFYLYSTLIICEADKAK